MEINHKKVTFWPNAKCDIPSNILMHMWRAFFIGWVLKGHGIYLFYRGKVMEESWNLKVQKEQEPWYLKYLEEQNRCHKYVC